MDPTLDMVPVSRQMAAAGQALDRTNTLSRRYGLALAEADIQALCLRQAQALRDTGRIAFGEGIYPKLVYAFCDSPYLSQQSYADMLAELCALFYHLKGQSAERWSDDELVAAMKQAFDGPCQGSLELMGDRVLAAIRGEDSPQEEEAPIEEE